MGSSQGRAYRNGTTFYAINLWSSTQELNGNTTRINWGANVQFGDWYYWGVRLHVAVDGVEVGSWAGACTYSGQVVINVSGSRDIGRGHGGRGVTVSAWTTSETVSGYGGVGTTTSCQHGETVNAKPAYTVSYNANGGSGAPGNQTKWYGENLTLSTGKPTRTGHNFSGWATSASGAVAYQPGATYTGNAVLTLYAKWTPHTYTVSYNANGGSGAPGNQTKTYGQTLKLSSTIPTRKNYNFLGWGTSAGSTTVAYKAGANYTANAAITLYAIWELAWLEPRITNLQATRCDSAGTLKEDGQYAKVTFKWATDRTVSSIKIVCNGVTTTPTGTGTSGTVNAVIGNNKLDKEQSYTVNVTVSDAIGGITIQTTVSPMNFIMDVNPMGCVAFGGPAQTYIHKASKSVDFFTPPVYNNRPPMVSTYILGEYGNGKTGYCKILTLTNSDHGAYSNSSIHVTFAQRNRQLCHLELYCVNNKLNELTISQVAAYSSSPLFGSDSVYVRNTTSNIIEVWVKKTEAYDNIRVVDVRYDRFYMEYLTYDTRQDFSSTVPSNASAVPVRSLLGLTKGKVNGYYGITHPDGSDSDWYRTTLSGLIPYSSDTTNGTSALGTEIWPFRSVWTNQLNWTGAGLKGRVFKQIWSGTWSSGTINIPDLPKYNLFATTMIANGVAPGIGVRSSANNTINFFTVSGSLSGPEARGVVAVASGTSLEMTRNTGSIVGGSGVSNTISRIWGIV